MRERFNDEMMNYDNLLTRIRLCFYILIISTEQYMKVHNHFIKKFLTKTYVVGTQKNPLNGKILLSTHNTCIKTDYG